MAIYSQKGSYQGVSGPVTKINYVMGITLLAVQYFLRSTRVLYLDTVVRTFHQVSFCLPVINSEEMAGRLTGKQ